MHCLSKRTSFAIDDMFEAESRRGEGTAGDHRVLKSTERVAHFLAEIDTLYQQRHVSSRPLSMKMSRAEIADYLGLTIETVSRAIGKLKNHNVIGVMRSDEVVILDNDRLRQIGKVGRDVGKASATN